MTLVSRNTADRFVGMAQRSRKIFGSKVGKNFWTKKMPTNLSNVTLLSRDTSDRFVGIIYP